MDFGSPEQCGRVGSQHFFTKKKRTLASNINFNVTVNAITTRTPAIVRRISWFNQTRPTLVLDLERSSIPCYLSLVERFLDFEEKLGMLKTPLNIRGKTEPAAMTALLMYCFPSGPMQWQRCCAWCLCCQPPSTTTCWTSRQGRRKRSPIRL